MATKAALAAALLLALVALASATGFTTTVVTTTMDEDANPARRQCRKQVQGRQFRPCQRYLEQRSRSPYGEEEEEELEMSTDVRRPSREEPYLEECCQQLRDMDRQQCGCEAIKQTLKQAQEEQEGGSRRRYQTGQTERIYEKARNLPRMCGLRHQQCRFNLVFV